MNRIHLALLGSALLLATVARADEAKPKDQPLLDTIGMSASVGGGVTSFINGGATDITKPGGTWTARLTVGTKTHFGGELAYIGSAQSINTLGIDNGAFLVSNGVEGNLRFAVLTGKLQPYATAGVAWRHYMLQNTLSNTSDVKSVDDVAEIPVGIGLSYNYRGFIVDGRLNLHSAFANAMLPKTNMSAISAGARLGFEF